MSVFEVPFFSSSKRCSDAVAAEFTPSFVNSTSSALSSSSIMESVVTVRLYEGRPEISGRNFQNISFGRPIGPSGTLSYYVIKYLKTYVQGMSLKESDIV